MNELTALNQMTSTEIALVIGKRHSDIMRDIRDEAQKLENGGVDGERKFALSSYTTDQKKVMPCYVLSKEGILQLAARYDAVIRAKLIDMVMKQSDPFGTLSPELRAIIVTDKKVQEVENRVNKLENTMTIDYSQQEQLRELANKVVVQALGGKTAPAYKLLNGKAFFELYRNYKRKMNVNSYKNTASVDFEKGKLEIQFWKPDKELALMITGANVGRNEDGRI